MTAPVTTKFTGRHSLVARLAEQVGSLETAKTILRQRGHMEKDSEDLTKAGLLRDAMTASERAKDRASKASGAPTSAYRYNVKTNRATKK